MTAPGRLPAAVLSRELGDSIAGRRVRVAVFTTFSFDPGFFELNVLPNLFDQTFSQVAKVLRIQLEDALRSVDHLAVYYDRSALAQDAEPAQLDYRRLDLRRSTGVFHPKLILLLVDEPHGENDDALEGEAQTAYQSLIVGVLSANLTRAGWWENVECAHFEEINDRDLDSSRCPFRPDLLSLLRRIRECAASDDDHFALDQVHEFLIHRTQKARFQHASSGGAYFTRLFCGRGRQSLADWLFELRLGRHDWNLEVISPYFDPTGAGPLEDLIDAISPRETRVYLPRESDGKALVTEETYAAVGALAAWSNLPGEILERGRTGQAERLPPRRVHAKVYRLWSRRGSDLLLVGSTNLTHAAMSHAGAGNLEASILVDITEAGYPRRWWLTPIEEDAERFMGDAPDERDGLDAVPLDLSFRYDWGRGELAYRLAENAREGFEVAETSGRTLFTIPEPTPGRWILCDEEAATEVAALLRSSSFLLVKHAAGSWRVLVREENMAHRPSLLTQLTPEEILEYWALLTPEQRAAFIEERVEGALDGLPTETREVLGPHNTLFDRFAGIYHSFGCLKRHIEEALTEHREREAEARLLGAKYDSLPVLLEKTLDRENPDPVIQYVTFLCARQLKDGLRKRHRSFFSERKIQSRHLEDLLELLADIRDGLRVGAESESDFIDWYEPTFLNDLTEGSQT